MPQIDLHMFQYTLWPLPIFRLINRVIIMSGVKELNRYPCHIQIQKIIYLVWVIRLRFSEKRFQITCTIYAVILVTLLLLGRFSGKKKIEQNGVKRIASLTTPQPLTWTLWLPMVVSVDYYREAPPFINQRGIELNEFSVRKSGKLRVLLLESQTFEKPLARLSNLLSFISNHSGDGAWWLNFSWRTIKLAPIVGN